MLIDPDTGLLLLLRGIGRKYLERRTLKHSRYATRDAMDVRGEVLSS
uniref:Uncharacterized protein n=1 Tax=Anopheles dirus TaxID=7168 RepID=A0A182NYC9_9DIPT